MLSLIIAILLTLSASLLSKAEYLDLARRPSVQDQASELAKAEQLSAQVSKLYGEGRYQDALPLAQQVLEIRERLLPTNDALLGDALNTLGTLYIAIKKDADAEKTLERALSVYESVSQKNDLVISRVLHSLAYIRARKNDYAGAESLLLRSVKIQEQQLGLTNPKTIDAMKEYACVDLWAYAGKSHLDESKDPDYFLKSRAICWVSGLTNDCSEKTNLKQEQVLNAKAVKLIPPPFPDSIRGKHLSGTVFVAILTDEVGMLLMQRQSVEAIKNSLSQRQRRQGCPSLPQCSLMVSQSK
jgi:tetratricopeptide (TPR) repeat protein